MFVSIATTHRPASDLGYLLMKHPERAHELDVKFGKASVFYPVANDERCEAVLTLDIDPIDLVRGRGQADGMLDQYVNDRPYAASSFLSVALVRVFRTAMNGVSPERQALADTPIPLEIVVSPLPTRGGDEIVRALFEPLGWHVSFERIHHGAMPSRYVSLRLQGNVKLADALTHIYVLVPVLDDDKHYWVGDDEVDKLIDKGGAWLAAHPAKDLIAKRYFKKRKGLARAALLRLAPDTAPEPEDAPKETREEMIEKPISLNETRQNAVIEALAASGARSVADLGCAEGKLLMRLVRDKRFEKLFGLDASLRSLERAADRLKLGEPGGPREGRVTLLHGSLTYRDTRWAEADAATLIEVIEHLDADRLPALAKIVFGTTRPKTVIVTTPNVEHNVLFPNFIGPFRHPDHRFEWTRAEFREWVAGIETQFGYSAAFGEIGESHELHGAPTQMAVLTR